ncbi:MAG: molybdopterin molybdotransferase MoeA [Planctomycetota bacterium]
MDRKTGDIRMRGFSERTELSAVLRLIERHLAPLPPEPVPVADSIGRVLTADQLARSDVPGFDRSAMDGYALRGEETFGATPLTPLSFRLLGEARPGHPFGHAVFGGDAVRIMTGAPMPEGADAVLIAEMSLEQGGLLLAQGAVAPGKNVGLRGEDIRAGTRLFEKGRRLRPQDAAVLASVGLETVEVVSSPTVSILITGDELLPPGSRPEPPYIVDTNSIILRGLVARDGGLARQPPLIPDDRDQVRQALLDADSDLILLSGGSSVGTEDHAPRWSPSWASCSRTASPCAPPVPPASA